MALDIRGGRKNTPINYGAYAVLDELVSNSIDSYLLRRSLDAQAPPFALKIEVSLIPTDLFGGSFGLEISCTDNGAGFGDEEVKAFVTKDSTYKDRLSIAGIGKCKGAGRIQFFHHFEQLSVDSVFVRDGVLVRRTLHVDGSVGEISEGSFSTSPVGDQRERSTTVTLTSRRVQAMTPEQRSDGDFARNTYSAGQIATHLRISLLQRLVLLNSQIGNFRIEVESRFDGVLSTNLIEGRDLPKPVDQNVVIRLACSHSNPRESDVELRLTRYSFPESSFPALEHEIALCANSAIVQSIAKRFLRNAALRKKAISGNFELILVESDLLEGRVNQQRDGFEMPSSCGESGSLTNEFSIEDVAESIEDYVFRIITPSDFDKDALVRSTEERFGVTRQMIEGANVKIHYGDSEENIARRVLKKLQEEIVADTSSLSLMRDQLKLLDPRSVDFREKVSKLSWKYASSMKKIDMASLSQLVVRRGAMIEVLRMAVRELLSCQSPDEAKKKQNERIIHNIFFPMGKDSHETGEHDIWLLNEEYQYFSYISSDKALSSIKLSDTESLFAPDIDDSLRQLFEANNSDHDAKRPDIAIFTSEGAAVIIEFKAPDVGIQEHVADLAQYARLLAAKSGGRLKMFYGYLIGTKIDRSRLVPGYTMFADGKGYFSTGKLVDDVTGKVYGEIYTELLMYEHFVDRAALRLRVYQERLSVPLA